jgi:hypothetical protein
MKSTEGQIELRWADMVPTLEESVAEIIQTVAEKPLPDGNGAKRRVIWEHPLGKDFESERRGRPTTDETEEVRLRTVAGRCKSVEPETPDCHKLQVC